MARSLICFHGLHISFPIRAPVCGSFSPGLVGPRWAHRADETD